MFDGHLVCAIDIETTGDNFEKHDIWSIACIPLNYNLDIHPDIMYVNLTIKPEHEKDIDWDVMRKIQQVMRVKDALVNGIDSDMASDIFYTWFDNLKLAPYKRILPITSNWGGLDKLFIQQWLGKESFNFMFDGRYRDVMSVAGYVNDRQEFKCEKPIFDTLKLGDICKTLGIDQTPDHTAFADALCTAKAYKKLCQL